MHGGTGLNKSYPAVAESVPVARDALARLARAAGAPEDRVEAVRLAASEALTNAVVHAYGDGPDGGHVSAAVYGDAPGQVHATAAANEGELWLLIADDGCGLSTRTSRPGLGMGLALIACMADYLEVAKRAGGGTEVRMRFAIGAPRDDRRDDRQAHLRGSVASANAPASSRFSTTT